MKYLLLFFMMLYWGCSTKPTSLQNSSYPIHTNITVTIFWIGEEGNEENGFIPNIQSVWDDNWQNHYGGTDTPDNRNGFYPADFLPKENPFYFALPYNDFDENGIRKKEVWKTIYWANTQTWEKTESMCKNRWIKITKNGKTAYAQWEDAGPFGEDDNNYVFGNHLPQNNINNNAGLDVSPAVRDYLHLNDIDKIDWQFIDFDDVPAGPWKKIITTSQIDWKD